MTMEWQPIETAPRDGTLIDLWSRDHNNRLPDCKFHSVADSEPGRWWQAYSESPGAFHPVEEQDEITHWMPRPAPPRDGLVMETCNEQWNDPR